MSIFSDLDLQLQEVREAMSEQPIDIVGRTLRDAFSAVDDLVVMGASEETRGAVLAERVMIGQLLTRVQLLASFIQVHRTKHPALKVIGHQKAE